MEDKTAEELIRIVEGSSTGDPKLQGQEESGAVPTTSSRNSKYKKSVLRFISDKDIKPGDTRIPVHKLVFEYYKWTNKNNHNRASNVELGRIMSTMFDTVRSGAARYYLLEPFCDLSKESLAESKKYYKANHLARKPNAKEKKVKKRKN